VGLLALLLQQATVAWDKIHPLAENSGGDNTGAVAGATRFAQKILDQKCVLMGYCDSGEHRP
jgi:hypothetical protein